MRFVRPEDQAVLEQLLDAMTAESKAHAALAANSPAIAAKSAQAAEWAGALSNLLYESDGDPSSSASELAALRTAVSELASFNFIQAEAAVRDTPAHASVVNLIRTMCQMISDHARASELLEEHGIDEEERL